MYLTPRLVQEYLAGVGLYDFAEILRFFEQKHPKYKLSENIQGQPLTVYKFFVKKSSVYTAFCCIQLKKIANLRNVDVNVKCETKLLFRIAKLIFYRNAVLGQSIGTYKALYISKIVKLQRANLAAHYERSANDNEKS